MAASVGSSATASHGNSVALRCLNAEIDAFSARLPRKALADDCGKSEPTFSKMTSGTQAFGLDDFERLPRDLQVEWMKRYGREQLGIEVRELEPAEINEEVLALVDKLHAVVKLSRVVGKPRPVQASIAEPQRRTG